MNGVALGVLVLPEHGGPDGTRIWRHVEELGVGHAWTYDHLCWPPLRGGPWFDAMTTLAAAAGATNRVTIGTLVASPNFRHPVTTATQAMTLDHLSGGRFVLGLGAGAAGADATMLGGTELSAVERVDRYEEFVRLVDMLLRRPETEFDGRYYLAHKIPMAPGCLQRPRVPFALAGNGARGRRLAAEFGQTWVTIGAARQPGAAPEQAAFTTLRSQLDRLADTCHRMDRDVGSIRKLVNISRIVPAPYESTDRLADLVGRCAEMGFTDVVVAYPRREGVFAGHPTLFERAITELPAAPDR